MVIIMGSKVGLYAVIGILVVALLAIGGYVFTKNNSSSVGNTTASTTISTQNNPTKSTSPTSSPNVKEIAISIQGKVTSYSQCRIGPCPEGSMFMSVQPSDGKSQGFDVYPETKIYDENGKVVNNSYIKVGQEVSVKGRTIGDSGEPQTIADEVRVTSQSSKIITPSIPPARQTPPPTTQ